MAKVRKQGPGGAFESRRDSAPPGMHATPKAPHSSVAAISWLYGDVVFVCAKNTGGLYPSGGRGPGPGSQCKKLNQEGHASEAAELNSTGAFGGSCGFWAEGPLQPNETGIANACLPVGAGGVGDAWKLLLLQGHLAYFNTWSSMTFVHAHRISCCDCNIMLPNFSWVWCLLR